MYPNNNQNVNSITIKWYKSFRHVIYDTTINKFKK